MRTRTNHQNKARNESNWTRHTHSRRAPQTPDVEVAAAPDFGLVREVQMKATGANIHALAQLLQIYVSAMECGAAAHARTAETQLRTWLARQR